ncbi:sensor histidine kinase [Leifsonia sp. Root227]|uniref:sensor histidine kinase n=1 Tax=Leifsonia sp. Root227 TaxID=1736496 RepID=UPI000AA15C49|nr:histidine kinase [Leifsonia sp. Root227]
MSGLTMTTNQPPLRSRLDGPLVLLWGVGSTAAVVILVLTSALGSAVYGIPVVLALGLGLAQAASIVLAIVAPRPAVVVSVVALVAAAFASVPDGASPWPIAVPSIVAQCFVLAIATLRSDWRVGLVGWAGGALGGILVALIAARPPATSGSVIADLIVFGSVSAAVLLGAVLVTKWQDVRRELMREQRISAAELSRRELAEERTRIARELHDVVAHGMSAIQVQASSARYRIPSLSEEAAEEFDDLAATARAAMAEMRRLLGVLRSEDTVVETAPQPGIGEIAGLVSRASRAGGSVVLEDRLPDTPLDPAVSLTVYRIVQEALSNVARHATGAATVVRLERTTQTDGSGDTLDVSVRNERAPGRPASAPAPDSGGHGIRGMRERTALLGGRLEAERTDDGGFVVLASIPVPLKGRA